MEIWLDSVGSESIDSADVDRIWNGSATDVNEVII